RARPHDRDRERRPSVLDLRPRDDARGDGRPLDPDLLARAHGDLRLRRAAARAPAGEHRHDRRALRARRPSPPPPPARRHARRGRHPGGRSRLRGDRPARAPRVSTHAATAGTLAAPGARRTLSSVVLGRFVRHRPAVVSVVLIVLLGGGAVFAERLSPRDPVYIDMGHKFARPLTRGHLLGADELGRDVLSRLLHAGRVSLAVGLAAMAVTVLVGAVVGAVAGYRGGLLDTLLLR